MLFRSAAELFARGLFPDPEAIFRPAEVQEDRRLSWINRPASGRLSGRLFTDGSCVDADVSALAQAGWAIVETDQDGNLTAAS